MQCPPRPVGQSWLQGVTPLAYLEGISTLTFTVIQMIFETKWSFSSNKA